MPERHLITRLGHLGDGLYEADGAWIAVPFAAPGDLVETAEGMAPAVVARGANHADPPCPHYRVCGGCDLQHVTAAAYGEAKREWIKAALARQGLEGVEIGALLPVGPETRRRAAFALGRDAAGPFLGFHRRQSSVVTRIPDCRILRPRIRNALAGLADLMAAGFGLKAGARATLIELAGGLDVAIEGRAVRGRKGAPKDLAERLRALQVLRLTLEGETLLSLETPIARLAGVKVPLPPGAFLQATEESEKALSGSVAEALAGAKRIADLYAGVGTFTFVLAPFASVDAYEGDAAAVAALDLAARGAAGLRAVRAIRRDLEFRPLTIKDLKAYDAVVLDPPRDGAEAQAKALAGSEVARIAYVSCFPASFARDARILAAGGYRLIRVQPVDQFLWSHHVELVGVFER